MSMDTIMEDSDYSVSNTDAIIYGSSDISGWTKSLISDPNISNSSSTSGDEYQQQSSQISTAGGGGAGDGGDNSDDLMIIASSGESSTSSTNNIKQSEQKLREFHSSSLQLSSARQLHECSICGLEFPTDQALGGHIRRHRAENLQLLPPPVKRSNGTGVLCLDLNLTPLENGSRTLWSRNHSSRL